MHSIKVNRAIVTASILAVAIAMPVASFAQIKAEVYLTKQDRNLYKVDDGTLWLRTHFCEAEAKNQSAFLITVGTGNDIIDFSRKRESVDLDAMSSDGKSRCEIKQIFEEIVPEPGLYDANARIIEANFYSIDLLGSMAIRTKDCDIYAAGSESADLEIFEDRTGLLLFKDRNETCAVTLVLEKSRL